MYYYGIIYKIAGNHIWRMVRNIKNKDNLGSYLKLCALQVHGNDSIDVAGGKIY